MINYTENSFTSIHVGKKTYDNASPDHINSFVKTFIGYICERSSLSVKYVVIMWTLGLKKFISSRLGDVWLILIQRNWYDFGCIQTTQEIVEAV